MSNPNVKKITRCALLLALMLIVQCFKNLSAYISGPLINTILVVAGISVGLWYGVILSVIAPLTSMLIAPASPMTAMSFATSFVNIPVIIIGNVILVLLAYYSYKKGNKQFILGLIAGSVLKWLFMWGCADLIIKPLFTEKLGKLIAAVNKVFSTLQLYSGIVGGIISYFVLMALDRKKD